MKLTEEDLDELESEVTCSEASEDHKRIRKQILDDHEKLENIKELYSRKKLKMGDGILSELKEILEDKA